MQHEMQRGRLPIRCVGGPFDGQTSEMMNPGSKLKLTVEQDDGTKVTHVYGRKNTRSGVEYRFKETGDRMRPATMTCACVRRVGVSSRPGARRSG
jgi:hypothetical protein